MHRTAAALLVALFSLPALAAVTGTVMTPDGAPVSGARVSIYALETTEARRVRLLSDAPQAVPLASTQTDARGNWTLESPKDPTAELRISAAGYDPVQRRIERDEEVGAIALLKAETKQGTIRAGGKPVAGATVSLGYSGAEYVTTTDAEGRYEAPDVKRLRAITVIHPSWAIDQETFNNAAPATALSRTLNAGTTISGRVVAADGTTPVAKATITVDGWPLAVSADDGTFSVAHAPAKWNTVIAQAGSLIAMRASGGEKSLTLRLAKPSTVTGRVIDAKTKLPVHGASVRVVIRGPRMGDGWMAVSDPKGNYSVSVPPGSYLATAMHPAYSVASLDVSVTAGQQVTKDFNATPLARVSGVVMSEDRTPLAAASVVGEEEASFGIPARPMLMRDSITVSGPDGRFSTRVQSDVELRIRASRKGLPPTKSEALRLTPGERKSGVVITIPNGIPVTGKVTDREGRPLSGVAIGAAEVAGGARGGMMRQMIVLGAPTAEDEPVRTGSDGTFTIRVKEGTYDFSFRREGYSTRLVRGHTISLSSPAEVNATLDPAVEITGRVVRGGNGVEGVNISTFSDLGVGASAVTAPDGSFTLSNLSAGEIRANLRKETEFIQETRTLTAPSQNLVIEIPKGTTVAGRVIDKETRKPVGAFQAGITTSRGGGGMIMMTPAALRNFTNDDGSFTLENVPVGAVNLVANAPGYAQARMNLTLEEGKPQTGITLELDAGTKVTGKVTGPDGSPLSGVTVRAMSTMRAGGAFAMMSGKQGITDAQGEYSLEAVEPTDEALEFSHAKYVGTRKEITVKGKEMRVDAQLSSGQRVSGMVVTEAGAPVADAEVDAMASAGGFRTARTDANGQFTFDSLVPSRYRFSASKQGFADARVDDVDISAGTPVRLVLRIGGTLYGQVRGLSAEELQSAMVEARGSDGFATASIDASGNFRMEGAPTGSVRVSAVSGRMGTRKSSTPQTVTLAAGESQHLTIEFRSDTVIRGRVTRNRKPLSSTNVTFTPKRGGSMASGTATTDEQGNYTVSGLEPGEYSVFVIDMQRFSPYQTSYEVRGSANFDIDFMANALRGRVLEGATNDPIADARVSFRATAAEGFRGERAMTTDVNGTFTFDNVAPGTYTVSADKAGFGNAMTELVVSDSSPSEVELRLSKSAGVTLKVVDARNGQPVNASVFVYDTAGRFVQDTGLRFGGVDSPADVKLSLAGGSYLATVFAMGYAPVSVRLTSPGSQTVGLTPGGKIVLRSSKTERQRIRLLDASGNLYPRIPNRVPAMDLPPSPAEIPLNNIAPGSYTLQILTNNDTTVVQSIPVTVAEAVTVPVDV